MRSVYEGVSEAAPVVQRPLLHKRWDIGGGSKGWQDSYHEERCRNVDSIWPVDDPTDMQVQRAQHKRHG